MTNPARVLLPSAPHPERHLPPVARGHSPAHNVCPPPASRARSASGKQEGILFSEPPQTNIITTRFLMVGHSPNACDVRHTVKGTSGRLTQEEHRA